MPARRVVITGLGAVTPLGHNVQELWNNLISGKSGIESVEDPNHELKGCRVAAKVKNFSFQGKLARRAELFSLYAVTAAEEAFRQSFKDSLNFDPYRFGCIIGVGIGGASFIENELKRTVKSDFKGIVSPLTVPKIISNAAPAHVSINLGLKGPNFAVSSACASGANAIGESYEIIKSGRADLMIAGGTESWVGSGMIRAFESARALCEDSNDNPENASRPFDNTRSGFVIGEGAGCLILEEYQNALNRNADIIAEIVGYATIADAYDMIVPVKDGSEYAEAIERALISGNINKEEIGYINAHGTSTKLNDKTETEAIKKVFGKRAYDIPISSIKSMIGHLIGASGAVEAVSTALTLKHQIIPPTINLNNPDPECDLDYVPNECRTAEIEYAISNSFGFGGHNTILVFKKYDRN